MEEAGFDERATAAGVRDLTSAVIELLPDAASARFDEVRVGLRPRFPTAFPRSVPSASTQVVMATGHFRNGVLLAPVTAEMVGNYVLEGVGMQRSR